MDTSLSGLTPFLLLLAFAWLGAISFFFFQLNSHYKNLVKDTKNGDLKSILEKLLKSAGKNEKSIAQLEGEIRELRTRGVYHIQKVGLHRFNPFSPSVGGDQSFALAVLDDEDSGFLLTALHTRERTRVYIKDLKKGKSKIDLSEEEKKAVSDAKK